ncbi:MAG: hypothetical protein RL095_3319 [Verrucomicrobiota bacterium]|jgi:hypothetical protein
MRRILACIAILFCMTACGPARPTHLNGSWIFDREAVKAKITPALKIAAKKKFEDEVRAEAVAAGQAKAEEAAGLEVEIDAENQKEIDRKAEEMIASELAAAGLADQIIFDSNGVCTLNGLGKDPQGKTLVTVSVRRIFTYAAASNATMGQIEVNTRDNNNHDTFDYEIEGSQLTLKQGERKYVFTREK